MSLKFIDLLLFFVFLNFSAIEGDNITNPGSVVAWLLEHPKVATSESESTSSVYESDTESVSYADGAGAQPLAQYVRRNSYNLNNNSLILS